MATKPKIQTLTNSSVDILNVIRNNATNDYKNYIPKATADAEVIRQIGNVLMDYPQLQNEFLSALVNRIGRVIVSSKAYSNPWAIFKKGMLEMGETIEEVFVNIAKPFQYSAETAEQTIFKREIPDVRSAFHVMNFQKYYKTTVQQEDLKRAFLSIEGVTDLISKIVETLYTGANYDEFMVMKYLLAKHILNGRLLPTETQALSKTTAVDVATDVKRVSNDMTFLKDKYNIAGVKNRSEKNEQYLLVNTDFDAIVDMNVLATAFNMEKAEFMGHKILVDGFGDIDNERLAILFADDNTYTALTEAELTALNTIPCVLVDRNYFMILDNKLEFTEQFNAEGLYWNYWYHTWKTFSVSPYANSTVFVPTAPTVTAVTVTPSTMTVAKGQSASISATVTTTGFAPKTVSYSSSNTGVTVSAGGLVTVSETATGNATITVASTFDPTKKATCTITIS